MMESDSHFREQVLALRAATAPADEAAEAWRSLMTLLPFDEISESTQRVVPAIFANIQSVENIPERARLRGVYRNAWVRNQRLLYSAQPVLVEFERRAIPYRVTKGMAVLQLINTLGSRVMSDIDVVIDQEDVDGVRQVLGAHGFRSSDAPACHHRAAAVNRDALNFNRGTERIDIHVSPFRQPETLFRAMLETKGSRPMTSGLVLADPILVVLHAMIHGVRADSRTDRIQAIIDVSQLMSIVSPDEVLARGESLGLESSLEKFLDQSTAAGIDFRVSRRPNRNSASDPDVQRSKMALSRLNGFRERLRLLRLRSIGISRELARDSRGLKHARAYRLWLQLGKSAKLESHVLRWTGGFLVPAHESLPTEFECRPFSADCPPWVTSTSISRASLDWRFGFLHQSTSVDVVLEVIDDGFQDSDAFVFLNGAFVTKIVGGDPESRTIFLSKVPPHSEVSFRPVGPACTDCYPDLDGMLIRMKVVRSYV